MPKKQHPERTCIITRTEGDKHTLLRFVAHQGQVVFDVNHNLPGRGVYVVPVRAHVQTAIAKNAFARGLEGAKAPTDLLSQIQTGLERSLLAQLGFAKKAGEAVLGLDRVLDAFKSQQLTTLILATDAGENAVAKLAFAKPVRALTQAQLSGVLGVPNATVVGLSPKADTACATYMQKYLGILAEKG